MILNDAGMMIKKTILEIPVFYPAFSFDQYIIMPNHVHAIVILNNINYGQARGPVPTHSNNISLSDLVKQTKTLTTKKYIDGVKNNNWQPFNKKIWQRSFHDHIIRSERSLNEIREYIINNPANWAEDEENINHT